MNGSSRSQKRTGRVRFCEPGGSQKLNRASRYVPLAGSQAAGAPRLSVGEEVKSPAAERATPPLYAAYGMAAGHDPQAGIMIPTLMARHRVKRPAIRMEGGTITISYGAASLPPSVYLPLINRDTFDPH